MVDCTVTSVALPPGRPGPMLAVLQQVNMGPRSGTLLAVAMAALCTCVQVDASQRMREVKHEIADSLNKLTPLESGVSTVRRSSTFSTRTALKAEPSSCA